ncbi:hypothetical protein DH2020_010251 [Rehmannia glutinosa]|uniref:RING-type E3 ubiquitin transferase n=1 Tax=Rehmannia glutinosa TaxID=99300 RepID=A0ABR0X995_REHGL
MSLHHRPPRRFLVDAHPGGGITPPPGKSHNEYSRAANFDTNMVIILAALLCALICALGINSIVRCFLRCAARMSPDGADVETTPRFGRKGLKRAALRQIPVAVYASGEGVAFTECPICLGEFLDGEKIRVLPKCHHCFHVKCVDVWLASHSSCPTCRQSLAAAEEEAENGGGEVAVGRQLGNVTSGGHGDASADDVG